MTHIRWIPQQLNFFLCVYNIAEINGTYLKDAQRISRIQYISHLNGAIDDIGAIEMNEAASIFDYVMAFDPNVQYPTRTRLDSIIKRVFKPNKKFQDIITPTCPTSFRFGRNFCWRMDSSIHSFILSPFDDASVRILQKYLQTKPIENSSENKKEQLVSEMLAYFREGTDETPCKQQLYYCARYVLYGRSRHQLAKPSLDETAEISRIMEEYLKFIRHFCSTIFDNRDFVINQFLLNQSAIDSPRINF